VSTKLPEKNVLDLSHSWHDERGSDFDLELPPNIKTLTGVRGFAALWVVLFHFQSGSFSFGIERAGPWIQHGFWGVDVFFVLSGFVLSLVYESKFSRKLTSTNYLHYLGLRLARIYPLHLLTLAGAFTIYALSMTIGHRTAAAGHFGQYDAIMNLTLLHAWGTTRFLSWNDVSWSISAEWFAYLFLLVPCVRLLRNIPNPALYLIAAIPWCLLIFVYLPMRTSKLLDMTYDFGIFRIAPEFLGGYVAYRTFAAMRRSPVAGDFLSIAGLAGIIFVTYYDSWQILLLPACILFLIGLSVEGPAAAFVFGNRISVLLGEVSYAIYMCHIIVLVVFDAVIKRLPLRQAPMWVHTGVLTGAVVAVLLMSYGLYAIVERPSRKWGRAKLDSLLLSETHHPGQFAG
jgi:peptidoglycan/LPS O-acetylase OafA/YrhL